MSWDTLRAYWKEFLILILSALVILLFSAILAPQSFFTMCNDTYERCTKANKYGKCCNKDLKGCNVDDEEDDIQIESP